MGEARRRKLSGGKIEEQVRDGVILLAFAIDPIPPLDCVLPAQKAMKQLDGVMPQLRSVAYENVVRAMIGEFSAANQSQEDPAIINTATIVALYVVLHNPLFGAEVRALAAEVRRNRHNLGLTVILQRNKLVFAVATGMANLAMDMIGKPQDQETFPTPKAKASEAWRTHVDPEHIADFGLSELHMVMFEPVTDRAGMCHTVTISIPETPTLEIRHAINVASKSQARTVFQCDTAEQAEAMAAYAAPLLPGHRRIAYERAEAGAWGANA